MTDRLDLLRTAYADLAGLLHDLAADGEAWAPTGCRGWAVHDLAFHLLGDARRALVGLATPAPGPADRDAVTYWGAWSPPEPGDDEALRRTRAVASTAVDFPDLVEDYAEVAAAVLVAAGRVPAGELVRTQGWVMEVEDLLATLVVEAAVHHLDLVAHLDRPGPGPGPLAEVRRVLEGLLDGSLPSRWDDVTAARRGTGREPLTDEDRAELGVRAGAFPLFG
ncbi:maleylpyruvate isomerase N-terminal domain-containing protein [Blastococcus sp. TML/M2B]|uniref:maleylpyruvate isomerase N-terminal domain-containing protein n=1 Tax=unclassified Blastococcus TaxID=2619396 RepID=UPI00190B552A|nr:MULTISPECIES: maleylpyruvate isomerase N-terminal domain-containing protein [unclassified Blastococcus]MBN1091588.1 maleylpyruvate isomerase N-terminal domain-containing protein [Blastococcus sp. TML/M2B]MBN1094860.1 maleylpyruvate isomerase N-terminal domain-containing protein [Blastococcus sp. TML/C7B]